MLCNITDGKVTSLSDGMTDDRSPCFDPEGKYLYFISSRTIHPTVSQFELNYQFHNSDRIYAITLQDSLHSPTEPLSDEETGSDDSKSGDDKSKAHPAAGKPAAGAAAAPAGPAPIHVDLGGIAQRQTALPLRAGNYDNLRAFKGKLLYLDVGEPDFEGDGNSKAALHVYDLAKQEDKTVISGVEPSFSASKDGAKVLYRAGGSFGIVDAAEGKKPGDGKVDASTLMAVVDPKQEWLQMYNETWRLERDFYYDPAMGGLDWKAVGDHYRELIPYVAHRSDLNYVIGELIGELATSHSYVSGGETPAIPRTAVGLLGADYSLDPANGLYRFQKIYRRRDWNSNVRAPLAEPGIHVAEGDYLLAVNGQPVRSPMNVYAAFVGTADQLTRITVGRAAGDPAARTYTVKPVGSEYSIRYTEWVSANRDLVTRETGGRVAYIHVPNTSFQGIQEFIKQYYPQLDRQGMIVDERNNGGGFNPEFFISRLTRSTWIYRSRRNGAGVRQPSAAVDGPKCMLINEHAGSGGDSFPYYFHMLNIGPLIGKRTWGGLVGLAHGISLVDGGSITMPEIGAWDRNGKWIVENHGVDPDIEVVNSPADEAAGRDPQLERAIQYCKEELQKNPPAALQRPPYKTQVEK
jgi:tricorn protease